MFHKYEKTFRIIVPQIKVIGKFYLSKEETKLLLGGKVIIEEKIDGANTGIIRHKNGFHLQKRGSLVGPSEHIQFQYFHGWAHTIAYDRIMSVPPGFLIYGELVFATHTIFYNNLPEYFLIFDVYNLKTKRMLPYEERHKFCIQYGFSEVPFLDEGVFGIDELINKIPNTSVYGEEKAEGIVVKKYTKKGYIRGKVVREEFIKHLEENDHWKNQPLRKNRLREKQNEN